LYTPPSSGNHANRRINHHQRIVHLHVDDSRNNAAFKKTHPNVVFDLPARGRTRPHAGNSPSVNRHNPPAHNPTTHTPQPSQVNPHAPASVPQAPASTPPASSSSPQDMDTQYGEIVAVFEESDSDNPQNDFIFYEMINENFDLFMDDSQYNGTNAVPGGPTEGVHTQEEKNNLIPPSDISVLSITQEPQISSGDGIATYAVSLSFNSESSDVDYELRIVKQ
jgi:hypothetical protein